MATFESVLKRTIDRYDKNLTLKPKQYEALKSLYADKGDLIVNLPVGYGKSLIYTLLPDILGQKKKIENPVVIVISPLNIIQKDQLGSLLRHGISACRLDFSCKRAYSTDEEIPEASDTEAELQSDISLKDVLKSMFRIILCHPEALLNTDGGKLILSCVPFTANVVAIAIDECHIVEKWGSEFRKSFSNLKTLPAFFPEQKIVALSGTLTCTQIKNLPSILGLRAPTIIQESPDRSNIFLSVQSKEAEQDVQSIYESIFIKECDHLYAVKSDYPVTLMFIPLFYMSQAAAYLISLFGEQDITNSLFSILYSNQDKEVIDTTIKSLKTVNPRIRLILTTSVAGMGFDPMCVVRTIHACPPRSVSQYLQEIGRSGRQGQPSQAILFYNNHDISKNLTGIQQDIIDYCKNVDNKCLRKRLLAVFGFDKDNTILSCKCCSVCMTTCQCEDCTIRK